MAKRKRVVEDRHPPKPLHVSILPLLEEATPEEFCGYAKLLANTVIGGNHDEVVEVLRRRGEVHGVFSFALEHVVTRILSQKVEVTDGR